MGYRKSTVWLVLSSAFIAGCATVWNPHPPKSQIPSQSAPPSATSSKGWRVETRTDNFRNETYCELTYWNESADPNLGISTSRTLTISTPKLPQGKDTGTLDTTITLNEFDSTRTLDPYWGKISRGPYVPWPKLVDNGELKVNGKVSSFPIVSSSSQAKDLYVRVERTRITKYIASLPGYLQPFAPEIAFRINHTIYTPKLSDVADFITCVKSP